MAVISTGAGQTAGWDLPRIDVVENVLLARASACITVPAALVLQTEEGEPTGSRTSFAGHAVGNIKVSADGAKGVVINEFSDASGTGTSSNCTTTGSPPQWKTFSAL